MQSGFRPRPLFYKLRVLSDILQTVDRGDVAALTLLDLSAAFDTVDDDILVQRLHTTFDRFRRRRSPVASVVSIRSFPVRPA